MPRNLICVVIIALIVAVYWIVFRGRARQYYLLFVGIITVPLAEIISRDMIGDPNLTLIPVYSIMFTVFAFGMWIIGRLLAKGVSLNKLIFTATIVFAVLYLSYFKYRHLLHGLSATLFPVKALVELAGESIAIRWLLPLGISYYVFRMISYVIDSYRGIIKSAPLHEFALYTFFFPIFVAGPIQRFGPFQKEIPNTLTAKPEYIAVGSWRVLLGAFKKVVIVDAILGKQVEILLTGSILHMTAGKLWIKSYLYALYIYIEFSALSDIAIGTAYLFGIKIMENFNWPYLVTNISRFWQRWHISLTSWLTDYIFKPLTRRIMKTPIKSSAILTAGIGYVVTMVVCGIWHGDELGFFYFGLYHGLGLAVWQAYVQFRRRFLPKKILPGHIGAVLAGLLTFHFICLSWPLFTRKMKISTPDRAHAAMVGDIDSSWDLMKRMLFITKAVKKEKYKQKDASGGANARKTDNICCRSWHCIPDIRNAGNRDVLQQKPGLGIHLHGVLNNRERMRYVGRHERKDQNIHPDKIQTGPRTRF
jgi:alginate O-acetyltransferase complex protein AlgI